MLQQRKNFVAEFLLELECKSCSALLQFSSVQLLSRVRLFATPWIAAHQASLSITSSQSLLKLMSIESVILSNHLILCHPLLLLPPIPPSIRVFSILKLNCCYSRIRGSFPWTCPACPLPVSTVTEQLWIDVHTWSDGYHCYHFRLFEGFTCSFLLNLGATFRKVEPQKCSKGWGWGQCISTVRVKTCVEIVECLLVLICCYCSVTKSCPTLCDPMDGSMPGFPVLHYIWEFAQIHVHWVSDAI